MSYKTAKIILIFIVFHIIFANRYEGHSQNKIPAARKSKQSIITLKYLLQKIQKCLEDKKCNFV